MSSWLDAAVKAMDAGETDWKALTADATLEALPEIFEAWTAHIDGNPNVSLDDYAKALMDAWTGPQSPTMDVSPEDWIHAFEHAGFRINGQPADRPAEPVTLFRGGWSWDGMSWTPSRSVAEWFANENGGEVWECEVDPDLILAVFDNVRHDEIEYVLDSGELWDIFES